MIPRILIGLVLLMAGCAGDASTSGKSTQSDKNLRAVENYQFDKAETTFVELLQKDSASSAAHFGRGYSAERQLLLFDALLGYHTTLQYSPGYAPAYAGLARTYAALGATVEAIDAARKYADLAKTDPDAWLLLADALVASRQYTEVNWALQQGEAAGLDSNIAALVRARSAALQHDFQTAGQIVQGIKGEEASLFRMMLANYYEARGLVDSAMSVSRAAYRDDPSHDNLIAHFFRSLRTEYTWDARQMLAEMANRDKSKALPTAARYFYHMTDGNRRAAITAAEEVNEYRPYSLSNFAYSFDARSNAIDAMSAAFTAEELMATINQTKAPAHFRDFVANFLASRQTIQMSPTHVLVVLDSIASPIVREEISYRVQYGYALLRGRSLEGYDTLSSQFMAAHRNDPAMMTAMGELRALYSPKTLPWADSLFRLALDADKQYLPAIESWVRVYVGWNEPQGALDVLEQYPHFAEQYPAMAMLKAICLAKTGRADEAVALATIHVPQVRGNSAFINLLVRGLLAHQHFDQARTVIAQALQLEPKNPDILAIAAYAGGEMKEWQEALTYADEGLDLDKTNPWLLAERARALAETGNVSEATRIFENLVLEMGNADGLLYYSRMLAAAKTDVLRAQELARQALVAGQMYHRAIFNLSHVYLLTDRFDLSRGAARSGIEIFRDDPEGYYLLGMALFNEKNPEARAYLQKAVDLGLKGDALQQVQATLSRI